MISNVFRDNHKVKIEQKIIVMLGYNKLALRNKYLVK